MRDLAGFREAIEQYRKQVGRTEEELARELYISKGELNKRLHDYSHPQSRRTWRLQPGHVKTIVETLARWGAITARKQAFALIALIDFPALAEEIDWQASPWNKLHVDASPTESSLSLSLPVRRRLFQARDLPKDYVPRPNVFNEIKRLVLTRKENQTTAITTALRGASGFGKTTLASALCHDLEIQEAFPDGILWIELGEHPPEPLTILNHMLHVLEPSGRETLTLEEARQRWQNVLKERSYLLVIDDVWQTDVLKELLQGGPRCGRLITTRNDQVLPDEAKRVWVDAMEPEEAMALLCQGLVEDWPHTLERSALEQVVVQQLGCWPMLVSLARGMFTNQVRRLNKTPEPALALVEQAYEDRGIAAFQLGDRIERQRTADACVEVNLRQLEEWVPVRYQARQRYLELAVFPKDTDIPLSALKIYWQGMGGLHDWEVEDLCLSLVDLSLLLSWETEQQTIRLHDVLRSYLIQRAGSPLPALHGRLLDAFQQHYDLTRWADLPRNEEYLWQHLIFHLCEVGSQQELLTTLTDLRYLTRTVLYRGVSALETDFVMASNWPSAQGTFPLGAELSRNIVLISHLLRQAQTEAEIGSVLLSYLDEKLIPANQQHVLERELPRPFVVGWHSFPSRSSSALLRNLRGHTGVVTCCAVSPDGQWIVSSSYDGTLKVWNASTGTERLTLRGHADWVWCCAVSPDGNFIVSASDDHTLKVWDAATGAERLTLKGYTNGVTCCAVSPDGQWIVSTSGFGERTLRIWDASTGVERSTLSGHADLVNVCVVSPDGDFIVSASVDHTLKVWDAATGVEHLTLRGHTNSVGDCAVSPDGQWIVSASDDHTLKVWDASTGVERLTLRGHTDLVRGCAVSPDGRWIVSASWDCTLKVWDMTTGVERLTLSGHTGSIGGCAVSPDGRWIVSASSDHTLKIWDVVTKAEHLPSSDHIEEVENCAVSPDGNFIVSALCNGMLRVRDATTVVEHLTLSGHIKTVNSCAVSPDGNFIVSASSDHTLKVWDTATGVERLTLRGHIGKVTCCAVSPDGRWIVSASYDGTLKVWDTATGVERLTFRGHTDLVYGCAVSPDGQWIVSASDDYTVPVYEAVPCITLPDHRSPATVSALSPDGLWMVSVSDDQANRKYGITTGDLITLLEHCSPGTIRAVSPDGRWIVSASSDHTISVYEFTTGGRINPFGDGHPITACAVSPDGQWIVSTSRAYTLKVWDATTGTERLTLREDIDLGRNSVVSPNRKRPVFSALDDHTLKVWDAATGAERLTLSGHIDSVGGCAVSPDGQWIVSVSYDGTLKLWEVQTGRCLFTFPVDGVLWACTFYPDGEHLVACGNRGMYFFRLRK